ELRSLPQLSRQFCASVKGDGHNANRNVAFCQISSESSILSALRAGAGYSDRKPRSLISFALRAISASIAAASCSGELVIGSEPRSKNDSLTSGRLRKRTIS